MLPEEKDVTTETSSPSEKVVEKEAANDQQQQEQTVEQQSETTSDSPDVNQESTSAKDSRPIENVAWEAKRKADELSLAMNEIRSALQEIKTGSTQQQQQPQYSKAQIQAYLQANPEMPIEHRTHWLSELDRIEKTERRQEMEEMFNGYKKKTDGEIKRQQSVQFVASQFPECFIKDPSGNMTWNNSNPLVMKIGEYMQNSSLRDNPEGLIAAAKMAAFDLGITMNKSLQEKLKMTQAQVKREQKKTLIAGGGTNVQSSQSAKVQKLAEEYRKTGNREVFRELAKARGLIPQIKE